MKRWMVVGLVAACGSVDNKTPDAKTTDSPGMTPDTAMPDAPEPPRCDPSKPFGAPQVLANVNSDADDGNPYVTADELEIWFASNRPGSSSTDIYMASRASKTDDFGQAAKMAGVNTVGADSRPVLTADKLTIYIQYLAQGATYYKITSATRSSTSVAFGTPQEVTALSSSVHDDAQYVLPDHSAMYFNSNRSGSFKLYRSVRMNGTFQPPALVDGTDINNDTNDYPTVTPDEKTIYFMSARTGSVGTDNWKATRPSTVQAFGNVALVTELNATEGYYLQAITADDCIAYVTGPNGANGNDIFIAKKPL